MDIMELALKAVELITAIVRLTREAIAILKRKEPPSAE